MVKGATYYLLEVNSSPPSIAQNPNREHQVEPYACRNQFFSLPQLRQHEREIWCYSDDTML